MRVILSFDVEIWCNGWGRLDEEFPGAFERYIYGHSRTMGGALPRTLEALRRHGIRGVFFVEPLFAARFGRRYLREIVELIGIDGHQIELHVHSEWADEIRPKPLPHIPDKRQHLRQLSLADQTNLIKLGIEMLKDVGVPTVKAFRAGSFGANVDTLRAVETAGLSIDCSVNACAPAGTADLGDTVDMYQPSRVGGVLAIPMTVFRDGFGRLRPAQVGACSARELIETLNQARAAQWPAVMLLSHNFEMLRPGGAKIDPIVARRFERLCMLISEQTDRSSWRGDLFQGIAPPRRPLSPPKVGRAGTIVRLCEQLLRRTLPT